MFSSTISPGSTLPQYSSPNPYSLTPFFPYSYKRLRAQLLSFDIHTKPPGYGVSPLFSKRDSPASSSPFPHSCTLFPKSEHSSPLFSRPCALFAKNHRGVHPSPSQTKRRHPRHTEPRLAFARRTKLARCALLTIHYQLFTIRCAPAAALCLPLASLRI
jgi:hypothetical protein